jgi:H+/Cl- antiporter ClcA
VVGYAAVLGLVMVLIAVVFIGVIDWLTELIWADPSGYGLFEGELWWILLIGLFGLLIGLARHYLKVEPVIPGLFEDIAERRVEPTVVPRRIVVALISLVSGASVGPEVPLGAIGGGIGTWTSERQGLSREIREVNTLSGMAGAFGGFFSSPLVSSILVIEAAKPSGARKYVMTWVPVIVAAAISFSLYSDFLDLRQRQGAKPARPSLGPAGSSEGAEVGPGHDGDSGSPNDGVTAKES